MNYGMPYKGSKNRIAQKIIDALPSGDVIVDLFGGGGAITHCAALSGKWRKIIYNELNPLVAKGFRMAVNGEFSGETRWISREDFHRLKNSDPYVAICFSFGNNLQDYAYSREIEPLKKALHNAGGRMKALNVCEGCKALKDCEGCKALKDCKVLKY